MVGCMEGTQLTWRGGCNGYDAVPVATQTQLPGSDHVVARHNLEGGRLKAREYEVTCLPAVSSSLSVLVAPGVAPSQLPAAVTCRHLQAAVKSEQDRESVTAHVVQRCPAEGRDGARNGKLGDLYLLVCVACFAARPARTKAHYTVVQSIYYCK